MDFRGFQDMLLCLPEIAEADGEPAAFHVLERHLRELEQIRATFSPEDESRHIDSFRRKCHHLILQSEFCYYVFARPRGYPGDFITQELIWHGRTRGGLDRYKGISKMGKLLTSLTFDMAAPRANEARVRKLSAVVREQNLKSIASIGCGSCIEFWDGHGHIPESIFLLDQDEDALAQARNRGRFQEANVTFCKDNILKFILKNNRSRHLGDRDLIYSFGLLDYFPNPMAKRIVASLWTSIRPGGRLLVTNAHLNTPTRLWMEWGGEWHLQYKSEEELRELGNGLEGLARVSYEIDDQGVYQYLELTRES